MINSNMRRKRKRKHNIYTKKAFLKNIKKTIKYCIYVKNICFLQENKELYNYYCKKFHLNMNSIECKILKAIKNKINWKNININDLLKDYIISKEKFSQQYLCEWV